MNKAYQSLIRTCMVPILVVLQTTAFAFIEDSEARREILKMRMQIEGLEQSLKESKGIIDGYKGGQIVLLNRIEELSKELAWFRGFSEEFTERAIRAEERISEFEGRLVEIIDRIIQLEPKTVSLMGQKLLVKDEEKLLYEKATKSISDGNFKKGVSLFSQLRENYPSSPLVAFALHSEGVGYYVLKNYGAAIKSLKLLKKNYSKYPKLPEAMLTLSAALVETKKNNEATKILKEIVENTPSTDAALTAKERLKALSRK